MRRKFQALRLGHCIEEETRFQFYRLGAARVAIVSLASLLSMIFGQSTVCDGPTSSLFPRCHVRLAIASGEKVLPPSVDVWYVVYKLFVVVADMLDVHTSSSVPSFR